MSKITKIVTVAAVFGIIGVTALPVASYAATDDVNVQIQVSDSLTISDGTDGGTAVADYAHNFGAAGAKTDSTGAASEQTPGTVTVFSNIAYGYILTLADKDANTNLVNGTNNIPTLASHAAGTPGWAVKVATAPGGTLGARTAMPASGGTPITLHNATGAAAATGDSYNYAFSTSISAATVAGTYQDTVTFTLTAK